MKLFINKPEINAIVINGVPNITVYADLANTLNSIGRILGFSYALEYNQRIIVIEQNGKRRLELQENISHHCSPCWDTVKVLAEDESYIEQYLMFEKFSDMASKI